MSCTDPENEVPPTDAALQRPSTSSPSTIFLGDYPTKLPQPARQQFQQTIAPILAEKLPQAENKLQEAVVQYFENCGSFYPIMLQNCDVADWIRESLVLDITFNALTNHQEIAHHKFQKQLASVSRTYEAHEVEALLFALKEKQRTHQLDLLAISDVLALLPADSEEALQLLHKKDRTWLPDLKLSWLQAQLQNSARNFSPAERGELSNAVAQFSFTLDWSAETMALLLAGIATEKDFSAIKDFLSLVVHPTVRETTLVSALHSSPPGQGTSVVQAWTHYMAIVSLGNKIGLLFPNHITPMIQKLDALLRHTYSYEAIDALLAALLQADAQEKAEKDRKKAEKKSAAPSQEQTQEHTDKETKDTAKESPTKQSRAKQKKRPNKARQAQQLLGALDILCVYEVDEVVGTQAFELIKNSHPQHWESEVHQLVMAATFQSAHERSVDELTEWIAEKAPNTAFANDSYTLKCSYQAVMDAYDKVSQVLKSAKKPIAEWKEETVTDWAQCIKEHAEDTSLTQVTQPELVAVIKRAVELHHGFSPRATQLLSVLILLNPASDQGRLAQINTGEGKSAIVAILAALHALQGKKVDVVTTSTELSVPEVAKQAGFFAMLDLTVDENSRYDNKKRAYERDVVYGTAGDFQGDILRTEFSGLDLRGQRGFEVVIVDEVDSMLYDSRSRSIRLSTPMPAMHHLEIVLAAAWNQVSTIARHLIEQEGQTYFVTEDFRVDGKNITLFSDNDVNACLVPVADKEAFIKEQAQTHLQKLLRDLNAVERSEWQAHQTLNARITALSQEIPNEENETEKRQKEAACERLSKQLSQAAWQQRYPILEIPIHLREFANKQIPNWVQSAIEALFFHRKELHYDIRNGAIVPIDYKNTGVLEHNLVWSDGLAQMLQIKEGLRIKAESVSTNFISTIGFFKRYASSIYGLTGTLGNQTTQAFFSEMYGTDMVTIPPYKCRKIVGNENACYQCKELPALVMSTEEAWYQAISETTLSKVRNHRAVLIICKYIEQVKHLAKQLSKQHSPNKIHTYTGQETFTKKSIDADEIIVATNIAGRGTDLTTSGQVEAHGGMHVCITFLPENYRVELQNAGRTARQGKKGSAQLVLHDPASTNIATLRAQRDAREAKAITSAKKDVQTMLFKDRLFSRFCALENQLLPTESARIKIKQSELIEGIWLMVKNLTETPGPGSKFDWFCRELQGKYPSDVLECFRERRPFNPVETPLSIARNWGRYERKALEERWGLWLSTALHERNTVDEQAAVAQLEDLFSQINADAQADRLVQNPYFYVLKGNQHLKEKKYTAAVEVYDRAIAQDPAHSVNARYNKAHALLAPKENKSNQAAAKRELQAAKVLLAASYKPNLLSVNALVGQAAGPHLYEHVQNQIDILSQQENYIEAAIKVIETAQDKGWEVELKDKELADVFEDAAGDRQPAIDKAAVNGLTHLFTITEKEPTPWWSICAVALIGLVQIAAGVLVTACTAGLSGSGLIGEGVSDLITSGIAAIQGKFSWVEWGIQKAISVAISLASSGWNAVKQGCKNLKNAFKSVGVLATQLGKEGLNVAAKQVGLALGKGIAKEAVMALANYGAEKTLVADLEQQIAEKAEKTITQALCNNPLVQAALAQDLQHKNNHWQEILIQEGLELLTGKDSKWKSALFQIAKGVASNKMPGVGVALKAVSAIDALKDLETFTDDFMHDFNKIIEKKYKKDIDQATETKQEQAAVEHISTGSTSVQTGDIPVHQLQEGTQYTSQVATSSPPLNEALYTPSKQEKICRTFKAHITARLTNTVQNNIVRPAASSLVNFSVEKMCTKATQAVDEATQAFRARKYVHNLANALGQGGAPGAPSEVAPDKQGDPASIPLGKSSREVQRFVEGISGGEPGDIRSIGLAANATGCPIELYNEAGKLIDITGKGLPGSPIKLKHTPAKDGEPGHWEPLAASTAVPSGGNNCLYDAIVSQLSPAQKQLQGFQSGSDFRATIVQTAQQNPAATNQLCLATQNLRRYKEGALLVGGSEYRVIGRNFQKEKEQSEKQPSQVEAFPGITIEYVSNKGGKETDHFQVGIIDEEGNFVTKEESAREQARGEGRIYLFRLVRDEKGVGSAYIAMDKNGKEITGFTVENRDTAIPEGEYHLVKSRERPGANPEALKYPDNYVLYNDQLGVSMGRGITIHGGNFPDQSQGCLLPGKALSKGVKGEVGDERKPERVADRVGYVRTEDSKSSLKVLEDFIGTNDTAESRERLKNLILQIFDVADVVVDKAATPDK